MNWYKALIEEIGLDWDEVKISSEKALDLIMNDMAFSEREVRILKMRLAIPPYNFHTYQAIGEQIGVTGERVRQILLKTLRKLRHPSRSRRLYGLPVLSWAGPPQAEFTPEGKFVLENRDIWDLEFSIRTHCALKNANIIFVKELIRQKETDILKIKNIGRKSLNEIKETLGKLELSLRSEGKKP